MLKLFIIPQPDPTSPVQFEGATNAPSLRGGIQFDSAGTATALEEVTAVFLLYATHLESRTLAHESWHALSRVGDAVNTPPVYPEHTFAPDLDRTLSDQEPEEYRRVSHKVERLVRTDKIVGDTSAGGNRLLISY